MKRSLKNTILICLIMLYSCTSSDSEKEREYTRECKDCILSNYIENNGIFCIKLIPMGLSEDDIPSDNANQRMYKEAQLKFPPLQTCDAQLKTEIIDGIRGEKTNIVHECWYDYLLEVSIDEKIVTRARINVECQEYNAIDNIYKLDTTKFLHLVKLLKEKNTKM